MQGAHRQLSRAEWSPCSHVNWWRTPVLNSLGIAAHVGNLDLLQSQLDKNLSLDERTLQQIMRQVDYRKDGKVKLARILQTLLDQGLIYESPGSTDTLDTSIIASALENETSAIEIMNIFLEWSTMTVPIDDASISRIFRETTSDSLTRLLFEKFDCHLPREVLDAIDEEGDICNIASLAYLAQERPNELPITNSLVQIFAGNETTKLMEDLLHIHGESIHVTTDVLESAVCNGLDGDMLGLLWPLRDAGVDITEDMLLLAATNSNPTHQREYLYFLLRELESTPKLAKPIMPESTMAGAEDAKSTTPDDEDAESTVFSAGTIVPESILPSAFIYAQNGVETLKILLEAPHLNITVTERFLRALCRHPEGVEMLDLLNKEKGIHIPITKDVLWDAASNKETGPLVIAYLAQLSTEPLPIDDSTLLLALENKKTGADLIQVLLPHTPKDLLDTGFFINACECGNTDAFGVILDEMPKDIPVDDILAQLSSSDGETGYVLEMLFKRNLVQIDENLVEQFAGNYSCMRYLLSWKPDVAINDAALWKACLDPDTMRELMAVKGESLTITEGLVNYIIDEGEDEVLEAILLRQESLPIAEKILWVFAENWVPETLTELLEKISAPCLARLWKKTSKNHNFPTKARVLLLLVYLKKTKDNITEEILREFPYDAESGENYGFDDFVETVCTHKEFPDLPVTEQVAGIIVERCGREAIEAFLGYAKISV